MGANELWHGIESRMELEKTMAMAMGMEQDQ